MRFSEKMTAPAAEWGNTSASTEESKARKSEGAVIHMNDVEYIIGSEQINRNPLGAYSEEALAFITDLCGQLLKSPLIRTYPDLAALAFWGRKRNLQKLKEKCPEAHLRLGRGVCFHVAPSNIPLSFSFSYMFGLLAGCSNIVRVPSKRFPQTEALLDLMSGVLEAHPEVKCRSSFIRYPADNAITEQFCLQADVRMIWGGDRTVSSIRSLRTQPKCIDICFADRYSISILDGDSVLAAEEKRLQRLVDDFYNDTYLMDQNACSSPQMICWMNDSMAARERFWNAVYALAEKKYFLQDAVAVDKYTHSCEDAIDHGGNILQISRRTNLLYKAEVKNLQPGIEQYRGHGGYFYEHTLQSIDELVPVVTEKFQTITYFGLDPELIREVVLKHHLRGIDRIAPVGKAMDVNVIWDGYDLIRMLSRIVNVE